MKHIKVDARGQVCPIPEAMTKRAIQNLCGVGSVETLVDNEPAVRSLTELANQKGYAVTTQQQSEDCFRVVMTVDPADINSADEQCAAREAKGGRVVVVISADHMGEGDETLGKALLKGFLYALTQQDELPRTILFYNGGARVACKGSDALEELRALEERGVEILTNGTCLNFYGLTDKLAVGGVTNMYDIVEKQRKASLIIRP